MNKHLAKKHHSIPAIASELSVGNTVCSKVYRLGGETDSAIRWRKRTSCDVGERPEEAGC